MATTTLIRPSTNYALAPASRTPRDLLLPVWNGEVLAAYQTQLNFARRLRTRTIESGDSADFPMTWKMGSETHEAGTELLGMEMETKSVRISLEDRPLVSHFEVDDIDMMLAQFESRQEMSTQAGLELAKQADKRAFLMVVQAATTAQDGNSSFPGGVDSTLLSSLGLSGLSLGSSSTGVYVNAGIDDVAVSGPSTANKVTVAEAMIRFLDEATLVWDQLDVPKDQRLCAVPSHVFLACKSYGTAPVGAGTFTVLTNADGSSSPFAGATTKGVGYDAELEYQGVRIFLSPNSPWNTNVTTGPTKWRVNASGVFAVAFTQDAAAWVEKLGVITETARDVRRQSDFTVVKTMHGGGPLRPYCAFVCKNA